MNRAPEAERKRAFWTALLDSGASTPLPRWHGPADAPEPEQTGTRDFPLSAAVVDRLRETAETLDVPVGTLVLAVHAKVLSAVTGERRVVTGYATGHGTVPWSLALADGSWHSLVDQARRIEDDVLAHVPFPLHDLRVESGRTEPLFDTVLDFGEPADHDVETTALRVSLDEARDVLRLTFRTELLGPEQVERIGGYYLTGLDLLTAGPEAEHSRACLLSDAEKEFQLSGLAGPRRELPGKRLHELFEERVRRHPDRIAAVHQDREWTYQELDHRANQIANALLAKEIRREDVVAVVTDRNLDWMASVLGVFKAGGCYLPVEPDFPADRIARTLARSECRFVLAEAGRTGTLDRALPEVPAATVLPLHEISGDTGAPEVQVDADQLAYVYFTSGSTGEPKGAMCEHGGMLNHVLAKIEDLGLRDGSVLSETPQCFDISLWQLVSAVLVGGRTLIVEQDVILDVQRFVDKIAAHRVQVMQLVPSYLEIVLAHLEEQPRSLPDLRCVSVTGEALKKELTQRWFATFPDVKLVNAYGLTETSDDTNHEVMDSVPVRDSVPLGPPVNNTHVYVVDENLWPVPLGAPGEIVFSGICVGRGYINDEVRTRASFLDDPHRPGQRLYRSGDFGRWLPEGKLEFFGRRDAQVKIRGFRIEIGEIENQLLRAPGVRDGAVVVTEDGASNKHLVAFYTGERPIAADEFKGFLRQSLPTYMVPEHFHHADLLPLTGNGKIDKKELARLAAEHAAEDGAHQPPRTRTEQRLAEKWAEVLGMPVDQIGRTDHFFDRGGTSLSAVRLIIKLDRQISLKDITGRPVLTDLAALIDGRSDDRSGVLQRLSTADNANRAVIVFPYAGGGPVNFHAFAQVMQDAGTSVYGVQLPGHDLGADAGSFADLEQTAKEVVAEIGRLDLDSIVLWGHSAGAAFALHTAKLLEEQETRVSQVIIGARDLEAVDELRRNIADVSTLSTEEVKRRLGEQSAFRELDELRPEHADNVAEAYRHDVRVAAQYLIDLQTTPPKRRLSAPLTVVFAEGDPGKADGLAHYRRWEVVAENVDRRELPGGGHYFLATHAAEAAAVVRHVGAAAPDYTTP